ncbi:MAG: penicillin-binding transpeptidase domain-containing protein [Turicibacter sp.]|nr:penicillin-binding transpeptidase domain-containing protein [Turicibacter sp.]
MKNRAKNEFEKNRNLMRNKRIKILGFMMTSCILVLLFIIGNIIMTYGADFERFAVQQLIIRQSNIEQIIPPAHGGVLDRNRQPLIDNEIVYNVFMDVTLLHQNPNRIEATLAQLYETLDISMEELQSFFETNADGSLARPGNWRIVARQVPAYMALALSGTRHVYLTPEALRRFPDPFMAPQVLGFVRGDASWGLENFYARQLTGSPGRILRSFQANTVPIEEIPPVDGNWLVTTLDSGIQRIAQNAATEAALRYGAEFAGVAVMNPNTGEILGMAQWPSFPLDAPDDGTRFTDPAISNFWNEMEAAEQLRHMNRTWPNFFLSRTFEQGSTFKPFVAAAAIEENIILPEINRFYCEGVRTVADWEITCMSVHGSLTLREALMVSCNIAMIDIAQAMGRDLFYQYRNDFGFGERTGIDLPGEEAVSSPAVMYTLSQLNTVELATSSFGQGFNATAIQTLNAFAALINGGNLMRPFVVSQIIDSQGNIVTENRPTVLRNVISRETSDYLRTVLQDVMTPAGTGRTAMIEGYAIGGKTGTGEQGQRHGDWVVNSFLGYFPVENPQYLVMVVLFNPENVFLTASGSVGPILRDIFANIIEYKQIPPTGEEITTGILNWGVETMPDLSGMELRAATPILNSMGLDYHISSRGSVISHHIPSAGQPVPNNVPVFLYLDGNISNLDDLTFVPNVEGQPLERAREMLEQAGLNFVVVRESTYIPDENLIVQTQFPIPGQHIQRGTQVRLRTQEYIGFD